MKVFDEVRPWNVQGLCGASEPAPTGGGTALPKPASKTKTAKMSYVAHCVRAMHCTEQCGAVRGDVVPWAMWDGKWRMANVCG